MGGRSRRSPVYSITGAQRSLSDDLDSRTRRYLIAMGIRTVCFVGAVVVQGPVRWLLVAGAIVLPYLSVVFANAGRERIRDTTPTTVLTLDRPQLGAGGPPDGSGGGTGDVRHSAKPSTPDTRDAAT